MSSKYQPPADWLAGQPGTEVLLTFAQIEQILGTPLPATAGATNAWWTSTGPSYAQTQTWLAVGWRVAAVDRRAGLVRYRREP